MQDRIKQLQVLVKSSERLKITSDLLDYSGVVEYHPEELVITIKAGTKIKDICSALAEHNQALPFYIENIEQSIGAAYAIGAPDLSDSVLGVQIIDGSGELLTFGGQVMKNVAGYDVARMLVGSRGQLAVVTQISFKVMPVSYIQHQKASRVNENHSPLREQLESKLKTVFDPKGVFE